MPSASQASDSAPYGGKICEGYDGAYVPEVGYVVQGTKMWFAFGKESSQGRSLMESVAGQSSIVESIDDLILTEDASGNKFVKDGIWFVEGVGQRSGVENANKRKYPRKIWERIIGNVNSRQQRAIKERAMLGHVEHPKDGRTDGNEGALLTVEAKLLPDGTVWARHELLDTPKGKILQEYTRKGVKWGVSTRGSGSVSEDGTVNEDYEMECWDGVMRPSTPGAFPTRSKAAAANGKGLKEDSSASGDNGDAGEMTVEAKACYEQARVLVETSIEGLVGSDRLTFTRKLLSTLGSVDGLAKSEAMPASISYDVRDWLTKKLSESLEAPAGALEQQIDKALTEGVDEAKGKRDAAFGRVIESFKRRMSDVLAEGTALRKELNETQESSKKLSDRIAALEKALDESAGREESLQVKLDVAKAALAEMSREKATDPVAEAVEGVIAEEPLLESKREQLEAATSVEEVQSLAESMLPDLMVKPPRAALQPTMAVTELSKRRTLPQGDVISEGITANRNDVVVATGGARMAASALRHAESLKPS